MTTAKSDPNTNYSGHAEPGGRPATRNLSQITVTKLSVGPMDNNVYLLRDHESGEQLLIDAAAEPDRILATIGSDGVTGIITTHAHQDHWGALAKVKEATGGQTMAHEIDATIVAVATDRLLTDSDVIRFGASELTVTHLRGHTEGSIALTYLDPTGHPHLFSGDCIFPGGVGKTWSDDDFTTLLADVTQRIFDQLPDDTWVYPGHGDDTTLGQERPQLAEWRARGW